MYQLIILIICGDNNMFVLFKICDWYGLCVMIELN